MTQLFAQPYDISANGFYFDSVEEYQAKAAKAVNHCGEPVEEFEMQFVDGEDIDCALAKAIGINQANIADFLELAEDWEDWEKINVIIACGECGYDFDPECDPDLLGVELYYVDSLKELAEQFVEEGLYGDIPESLQYYIDYGAIARDLGVEYSEIDVAGQSYVYRCI